MNIQGSFLQKWSLCGILDKFQGALYINFFFKMRQKAKKVLGPQKRSHFCSLDRLKQSLPFSWCAAQNQESVRNEATSRKKQRMPELYSLVFYPCLHNSNLTVVHIISGTRSNYSQSTVLQNLEFTIQHPPPPLLQNTS